MNRFPSLLSTAFLLLASPALALDATFDLSTTPQEDGSSVLATSLVTWSPDWQSRVNVTWEKTSTTETSMEGFGAALQNTGNTQWQLDLLPAVFSLPLDGALADVSVGVSVLNIDEKVAALMKDTGGTLLSPAGQSVAYKAQRRAWIVSPRIGASFTGWAPVSFLEFSVDGYISPFYLLNLDQSARFDFQAQEAAASLTRWSSFYAEGSFNVDVFHWVRGVVEPSYQRLDFQTLDWNSAGKLAGVDDLQNLLNIRYGLELLLPVQAGDLKFYGGVFFETSQTQSSHWNTNTSDSKVTFRYGIEG